MEKVLVQKNLKKKEVKPKEVMVAKPTKSEEFKKSSAGKGRAKIRKAL
jgi:hypothetical protein